MTSLLSVPTFEQRAKGVWPGKYFCQFFSSSSISGKFFFCQSTIALWYFGRMSSVVYAAIGDLLSWRANYFRS